MFQVVLLLGANLAILLVGLSVVYVKVKDLLLQELATALSTVEEQVPPTRFVFLAAPPSMGTLPPTVNPSSDNNKLN
jgi:hypothetical protein